MFPIRVIAVLICISVLSTGAALSQQKVMRSVTNDTVEKVLQDLQLKYAKEERKNKNGPITYFTFSRGEQNYGLYNYGTDLWIESIHSKTMRLDDVNRWNGQAKFSRLVLIDRKDKTEVSLESQLDALGGITEVSIRQFINRFDEEAKQFAKFK